MRVGRASHRAGLREPASPSSRVERRRRRHDVDYATDGFDRPARRRTMASCAGCSSHRREAGLGTDTLAGQHGLLRSAPCARAPSARCLASSASIPKDAARFEDPEQRRLADALATQIAMALERARLAEETERARVQVETEQLRSTLLSSVSHDLRTPLAVMKGAASTLVDDDATLAPATRKDLAHRAARGDGAARPAGPQPARHDAPRVGRGAREEGVAVARGGRRRARSTGWRRGSAAAR